jgi:alkanesulfonate monooxygenase SsuD/methylene tetrahydromethanopterin reductase-like flavin-dependent oxidoreductase (luciferase family)
MFLVSTPDPSTKPGARYGEVFRLLEHLAAAGGFEGVWFAEHHFSDYGYVPNPLMLLSHAHKVAPDLRLGTAVVVLPLWHPLRLAEDLATLDLLSGGKLDLGIGRGYQPYEFDRLGADLSKNREQFNECLDIVLKAWTEEDFEYEGKFWQIPRTTVFPKPAQNLPPIWMAATSPPSIRAAVKAGYHVMTGSGAVFEELKQRNAYIDTLMAELGRPLDSIERSANRYTFCSTSQDEIDRVIPRSQYLTRVSRSLAGHAEPVRGHNKPVEFHTDGESQAWADRMVIGNPDECIRQVQLLADAGITYVHAFFDFGGLDEEITTKSAKLFCDEVMPALKEIAPSRVSEDERQEIIAAFASRSDYYSGI